MDYQKDKDTAQQKKKIDPQFEEVREAIISLNASHNTPSDVGLPEDVDPVIAEGVRNTVTENFKAIGLYTDEYKDLIENAIKINIQSIVKNKDDVNTKALIEYYYEKAQKKGGE